MFEDVKTSNNGNLKLVNVCVRCNAVLDDDATFCDECGAAQTEKNSVTIAETSAETMIETKTCPRCHRAADIDEMFCVNCAFDFSKPVTPTAATGALACPKCQKTYNAGDKFCRHCAFDLSSLSAEKVSSSRFCTNCGKPFNRDDRFCRHCAFDLTETKHTVVMQKVNPLSVSAPLSTPAAMNLYASPAPLGSTPPTAPPVVDFPKPLVSFPGIQTAAPSSVLQWTSPIGAAIAGICFFLPWVNGSVKVLGYNAGGMAFSGADISRFDGSLWLLPLAALVSVVGFSVAKTQNKVWAARPVIGGSAAFAFVFLIYKLANLRELSSQIPDLGLSQYNSGLDIQPQIGIFGLFLGFLVSLIGIAFLNKPYLDTVTGERKTGMSPAMAAMWCYLPLTFILGILAAFLIPVPIFMAFGSRHKNNRFVRFHAIQALLSTAASFVLCVVSLWLAAVLSSSRTGDSPFIYVFFLIYIGVHCLMIFCMVKAYKNEEYKLPYIGDLAMKWANRDLRS